MSISTFISFNHLCDLFKISLNTSIFTFDHFTKIKSNKKLTNGLYHRCADIIEDIHQISNKINNTNRLILLINCIVESFELCRKYEKKNKVKRFLLSSYYKKKFLEKHIELYLFFLEFNKSIYISNNLSICQIEIQ